MILVGGEAGLPVIQNIALCMVSASLLGLAMKALRQPLILGHMLAGVFIGPLVLGLIRDRAQIETIAEIGLILLLFMIGLEIDLRKMLAAGRLVLVPGLVQFPICAGLGLLVLSGLEAAGIGLLTGGFGPLYAAIALALSSTMIVVKLLYEKFELDTLAGRITVGILVFQDLWAIVVLALQPNFANPDFLGILKTFGAGGLLVGTALLASRYVLPRIFKAVAKLPELMLVLSLGWCFLVGLVAAHPAVGLSMEMGALIAGVSLATFPYNLDVIAKVVSIRDFFVTLFFVALGMQIPAPEAGALLGALLLAAVALATRLAGVFGVLHLMRAGHRVSLLATVNLAQMSEFSLVILALGVQLGHIGRDTLTLAVWVFSLLAVGSTYLIAASHPVQEGLGRLLARFGLRDLGGPAGEAPAGREYPVVILGFYRTASAFLAEVEREHPDLLGQIKVVDFNPLVRERLAARGVACVYGDVGHLHTLEHAGVREARMLVCSLPDHILKGTTNSRLLRLLRTLCPGARIFLTAENHEQARALYAEGADFVLQPAAAAGAALARAVTAALRAPVDVLREEALKELAARREVL